MSKFEHVAGFWPGARDLLDQIDTMGPLPFIRGQWYFVDPTSGSDTAGGKTVYESLASISEAYERCLTGAGDGICLLSRGTGTSSQTTSYLKQSLTWSKHGITVFGAAAPVAMFGRARVANLESTTGSITTISFTGDHTINDSAGGFLTAGFEVGQDIYIDTTSNTNDQATTIVSVTATTMVVAGTITTEDAATAGATEVWSFNPEMIVLSGSNNTFINVHIGNFANRVRALGGVQITGHRNAFVNCHIVGAGGALPGSASNCYNLFLDGGQENTFRSCVFGTDTVLWSGASGGIVFDSDVWRSRFYNCEFIVQSATAGTGAIKVTDATSFSGWQLFKGCTFLLWNDNGVGASTALVIGTKPNSGQLMFDQCSEFGWSAWGAAGMSGCLYVAGPTYAASAGGSIATTL